MKRILFHPDKHFGSRAGTVLLAASLIAGPLASSASAVEGSPTATPTATTTTTASPAPETTAPTSAHTTLPASEATPTPVHKANNRDSPEYRAAMAAIAGPGGAEMGQGSSAGETGAKAESLTTQSTWTPSFGVQGLDVSYYQSGINWQQQWDLGARFAYVKATEGNYYSSPSFSAQFQGSRNVGMVRGAYHFANPAASSGADQARLFVQSGGGWTSDGYTLPPVLDFEGNPYAGQTINGYYQGNTCYDMSPAELTSWARDFGNTMMALTGRKPVMYTTTSWWNYCTGGPAGFGDWPLWIARWPSSPTNSPGSLPSSWTSYSFWQYSESGPFAGGGDSNVWNGDLASLKMFATGQPSLQMPAGATAISGRWYGGGKSYGGWTLNGYWCLQYPMGRPWCFWFGNAGDKPVAGDWDGNGVDTIGIVRNGVWQLTNDISRSTVDKVMYYGLGNDIPVTGDWDGDGVTNVGIVRNAMWNITISTSMYAPVTYAFYFGNVGDTPITGSWTGSRNWGVGVHRRGVFYLSNNGVGLHYVLPFGNASDVPVVGDWDGSGGTSIGIIRGGVWQLTNNLYARQVDLLFN